MSGEGEVNPSSAAICINEKNNKSHELQECSVEELENPIQDQIILAPEIMENILGFLDFQSLKQVRLVCKSWLLEAHAHMERRGIVELSMPGAETEDRNIQLFFDTCSSKIQTLPVPFQALNVIWSSNWREQLETCIPQLIKLTLSPFGITRLDTERIPLPVVIPFATWFSSSLEYLHLSVTGPWTDSDLLDPKKKSFPQLRHLYVETIEQICDTTEAESPALFAWLVRSSPNLETYEFQGGREHEREFISALVMQVDARNVKALKFATRSGFNDAAVSHFSSMDFRRLEALQLELTVTDTWKKDALTAVVARSCMTLKELDLTFMALEEDEDQAGFPVCPNVEAIRLTSFTNNFLPAQFPSLRSMTIECYNQGLGVWADIIVPTPVFSGLKRLRIKDCETTQLDEFAVSLFENVPSPETLCLENTNFMFGSSLASAWVPNSLNLVEGVKHLVVYNDKSDWSCRDLAGWYSLLSLLTGLESIELSTNKPEIITTLPVKDLPHLELIRFPWDDFLDIRKLLKMTQGVKKVFISNYCSVLRSGDAHSV